VPVELAAQLRGIGVLGPGLPDWPAAAAVLAGAQPYASAPSALPDPDVLPAAERRRAGGVIKLALAIGAEAISRAGADPSRLPSVFSSSGGDGENCHRICETLASADRRLSPTRFHNSVHNAAAGYWSIAHQATPAFTALCAFDASFAAGLLEAFTQVAVDRTPVLLLAYDTAYPPPLHAARPIPDAFGIAMVLAPPAPDAAAPIATLRLSLQAARGETLPDPALEALRRAIPAARGLPLLRALARGETRRVLLDYLDATSLAIDVSP
jgi:hypothetical protein